MRLVAVFFCSAMVLASPVFAQQLGLAPAKPDCAPGEPDSIQVSWNKPCDEGNWLFDPDAGCRMWDWHPDPDDKVVWTGSCRVGLADGQGEARWFEHGHPIDRFVGTYRDGKREGPGRYEWNDNVSYEGTYANDVPHGNGTVRIDDVVLTGRWIRGCLAETGKVVAIGVPRSLCGAKGKS